MKICPECYRCYDDGEASCREPRHGPLKPGRDGSLVIAGSYRLERLLGTGAMGAVYQGTQLDTAQARAIKMLNPGYSSKDPAAIGRLRNEFHTGDLVGHQNIVRVYDYIELEGGEACIAMELIDGVSLRDYMRQSGEPQLSLKEAVNIAFQTAQGIDALHKKQLLHRDLKPENIMLTRDEQGELLVKVVDFGLAKSFKSLARAGTVAPIREFVGTMLYTSPENCRGEDLDERSDIYSLGVILYEMLTGRPPFTGRSSEVEQKHLTEQPTPLSMLRPDAPPALAQLVMETLKKEPQARPQSARDFAHMLKNIARTLDLGSVGVISSAAKGEVSGKAAQNAATSDAVPSPLGGGASRAEQARPSTQAVKVNNRRKPRTQVERPTDQQPDFCINNPVMTSSTDKNRRQPKVINRHRLNPERPLDTRRVAVVLGPVLLLCLLLIGSCYVYPKYKLGQFESHLKQGQAKMERGENDAAIAEFTEAIRYDPIKSMPYYYRAIARYKKGDYEQSISDYSEVIRLTPDYALAYQNRANVYIQRGEYQKGIDDYTTLLRFAPDSNTYKLRGDAYFKNKNYNEAITDYSEAIRIDPNNLAALMGRADAYGKRGGKGDWYLANADRKRANQLRK